MIHSKREKFYMNMRTMFHVSIISSFIFFASLSPMQQPLHPSAQTFYSAFIISINKCSNSLSDNTSAAQAHLKNAHRSLTGLYHQNSSLKTTPIIDSFLQTPRKNLVLTSINIERLKKDVQQNTVTTRKYFLH